MASTELPFWDTFIPRTPLVSRPIAADGVLREAGGLPGARDHEDVVVPLVRRTAISSSSSRMLMAMMPSALIGVL